MTTYAINLTTGATTRYEGFDFNSMCRGHDGKFYGLTATGLFELTGDLDDTALIEAMVGFGKQDFGSSNRNRLTHAYLGVASSTEMMLRIQREGEYFEYPARSSSETLMQHRVDLGRGLEANWFGIECYALRGGSFTLADMDIPAIKLKRKI